MLKYECVLKQGIDALGRDEPSTINLDHLRHSMLPPGWPRRGAGIGAIGEFETVSNRTGEFGHSFRADEGVVQVLLATSGQVRDITRWVFCTRASKGTRSKCCTSPRPVSLDYSAIWSAFACRRLTAQRRPRVTLER